MNKEGYVEIALAGDGSFERGDRGLFHDVTPETPLVHVAVNGRGAPEPR